jgi:hypothetical protein
MPLNVTNAAKFRWTGSSQNIRVRVRGFSRSYDVVVGARALVPGLGSGVVCDISGP